ncbi:hypothetical protein CFI11_05015 [Thalassococcus sp. S3]|nr:hypothetical protein CFI11_05015 [Thalassococcus sp. S3]
MQALASSLLSFVSQIGLSCKLKAAFLEKLKDVGRTASEAVIDVGPAPLVVVAYRLADAGSTGKTEMDVLVS